MFTVSYEALDAICPSSETSLLSKDDLIACMGKLAAEEALHQTDIDLDQSSFCLKGEITA